MIDKRWTVIVERHSRTSSFQFSIGERSLVLLKRISIFFFVVYLLLLGLSIIHDFDYNKLRNLEKRKTALEDSLMTMYEKLVYLDNKLDKTNRYYAKIQMIADIYDSKDINRLGTGGRQVKIEDSYVSRKNKTLMESISQKLNIVENKLNYEKEKSHRVGQKLVRKIERIKYTPSIWPTYGRVSAKFGIRKHPITGKPEFHKGVDIANRVGTPVVAAADGKVVYSGWLTGYGKFLKIKHAYGYMTCYGHLSKMVVHVGQTVKKGQLIGYMGSTGLSTGSHLHYEVRINNKQVNPLPYMLDDYRSY